MAHSDYYAPGESLCRVLLSIQMCKTRPLGAGCPIGEISQKHKAACIECQMIDAHRPGDEEGGGREEESRWGVGERPPQPLGSSEGPPRRGRRQRSESPGSQRHLVAAGRSALGPLGAHRKPELFPISGSPGECSSVTSDSCSHICLQEALLEQKRLNSRRHQVCASPAGQTCSTYSGRKRESFGATLNQPGPFSTWILLNIDPLERIIKTHFKAYMRSFVSQEGLHCISNGRVSGTDFPGEGKVLLGWGRLPETSEETAHQHLSQPAASRINVPPRSGSLF
ncbi:PREDICTED: uncharacterized protein LOC105509526 [Colobus angolensis palliatus]|uniref:uncharacterized protein LOC105509526 n=1 Tax=Colobus angolensis palliatus TaxID=336983 RepID=UPI0005F50233|nr:PREDICTED: uncharacterized protein LOC105509526 [Colobus angolensis palliatus]